MSEPEQGADLRKLLLTYGPAFLAPALWSYTRFPDQLKWTGDLFARIFGLVAAFYDDWTGVPGYGDALEEAISEIASLPKTILDLATGTGYVARRLKKAFGEANVTGIDIAPSMVAIAQHDAVADGLDVRFEVGDNSATGFPDETFDLVCIQNAFPFLDEIMRVLAPGGTVLVVWSFGGPWVSMAWPAMSHRIEQAGGGKTWGRRAGSGFYGMATKQDATVSSKGERRK